MKSRFWIGLLAALVIVSILASSALVAANTQHKGTAKAEVIKSPTGAKNIPLGLEKIVFIHYRKGHGKPPGTPGGGKPTQPKCYGFLAKGAKWQALPISCVIDPALAVVPGAIPASATSWDDATSANLFSECKEDESADWDSDAPDGRNELSFGNYPEEGVIAVTVIWGYFSGPPASRKIVEFDILFDLDYEWADAEQAKMDLQNIATHEFGHGLGLADVYETACTEVTMYGYSDYGEIKKRDLESADITGLRQLYGE